MATNPYKQGTSAYTIWEQGFNTGHREAVVNAHTDEYYDGFQEGMDQGHESAMAHLSKAEREQLLANPTAMALIEYCFEIIAWEAQKNEKWVEDRKEIERLQRALNNAGLDWRDPRIAACYDLYRKIATEANFFQTFLWDNNKDFIDKLTTIKGREETYMQFERLVNWAQQGASSKLRKEGRAKAAELVVQRVNEGRLRLPHR